MRSSAHRKHAAGASGHAWATESVGTNCRKTWSSDLQIPDYAQLLQREDAPAGSAWGIFGVDDRIGTLNFIGPEQVISAVTTVSKGRVFPLNLSLDAPKPGFFDRSPPLRTTIPSTNGTILDDYLDRFYPQSSSHWDALLHCADPEHGFYNRAATLDEARQRLGVHHLAQHGIVARGVLVDIPPAIKDAAATYDPLGYFEITAEVIARTLTAQHVVLQQGDILLLRTGWLAAYLSLDHHQQADIAAGEPAHPGLFGSQIPEYLWDHRIAAVASDNPALEAARPVAGIDLVLHRQLIARLGMPLGELWNLEDLALDCAEDGRFTFLLVSSPMNIPNGAGSPANAIAIK
jgi:kynurenine formamidase